MSKQQDVSSRSERVYGIDAARTVAALGTVWAHSIRTPGYDYLVHLGRFAVPYFAFIAAWFMVSQIRRDPSKSFEEHVSGRFDRLYSPFLFWSVAYYVARVLRDVMFNLAHAARGQMSEAIETTDIHPLVIFSGTTPHLWFLPFLFFFLSVSFMPVRWALRSRARSVVMGWLLIVAGIVITQIPSRMIGITFEDVRDPMAALSASWERCPSFLWGLAAGLLIVRHPVKVRLGVVGTIVGIVVTIASVVGMAMHGHNDPGHGYSSLLQCLSGLGWLMVALGWWPKNLSMWFAKVAVLSYGVYLSHILFTDGMRLVRIVLGIELTLWFDMVRFVFSVIGAFALSWMLRRHWATRWLIP